MEKPSRWREKTIIVLVSIIVFLVFSVTLVVFDLMSQLGKEALC